MSKLLNALGLMRVSEHEELTRLKTAALDQIAQSYCTEVKAGTDWEAKFKLAATDLAAQAEEIGRLQIDNVGWQKAAADNFADAQKWRIARQKRVDAKGGRG